MSREGAKRKKVLVVDDSPENIRILLEVLKDDYLVIAAKDGNKALEMAAQEPSPDLILLDVLMPVVDGYQVCSKLKADEKTKEIPVIFVTALAEDVSEEKGLELGAVDYITKPISPSVVRARVRTHLALKEAQQQMAAQNQSLIEAAQLREDVERIMQHDLKGPLTTIISMPSLLIKKDNITDQQKEILNLIKEAGYLMLTMINNSLDLYKMETGSYDYVPEQVDLLPVLRKVLVECDNLSKAHEVDFDVRINGDLPGENEQFTVRAEELLSHTMLSNLIKNAVEASPPETIVSISLHSSGSCPSVEIKNSGEVPEAVRDRFFEKYVTAGKSAGTGLGTYSAYMAAKTQGGNIRLDTTQPGFTVITVELSAATS